MADKSGFPDCTPWKNYRYPLTRLTADTHYTIESATGAFTIGMGAGGQPDIWVNDDWFLHGDALGITYKIIMHGANPDSVKSITVPKVFINGTAGTDTRAVDVAGGAQPLLLLSSVDNNNSIDVASSLSATIGSEGNAQSLFTAIPGLHFGFPKTTTSAWSTDNEFSWSMKSGALDNLPKVMDNTYTCWYKSPNAPGDTVVTAPLPSGIGNKGFNVLVNGMNFPPKHSNANPSWGTTVYTEGSVDGVNWFTSSTLIGDSDLFGPIQAPFDSNALDGDDFPFKRIKVEFATGGTALDLYDHQYQLMAITPH